MKRKILIKIGDVFQVNIGPDKKMFIQYIADDHSYMNSRVIRVFKESFRLSDNISIDNIVKLSIDFYAHTNIKSAIKDCLIEKIGNSENVGILDIWFRDYLDPLEINSDMSRVAINWRIWKINEPFMNIVDEIGHYEKFDRGGIIPFSWILRRMIERKYHYVYPNYRIKHNS